MTEYSPYVLGGHCLASPKCDWMSLNLYDKSSVVIA